MCQERRDGRHSAREVRSRRIRTSLWCPWTQSRRGGEGFRPDETRPAVQESTLLNSLHPDAKQNRSARVRPTIQSTAEQTRSVSVWQPSILLIGCKAQIVGTTKIARPAARSN